MSDVVQPFSLDIPDTDLEDLRSRLSNMRLPEKETVDDWSQGIPQNYVREIGEYWKSNYNWREREAMFNRFPQYTTELDGLDIHFMHIESKVKSARPLVLTHGWPGSIVEFMQVIEPLTNPTDHGGSDKDAFHLVIPSLPGFGFSGKPQMTGWGVSKVAKEWVELMKRLGYDKFFAQGGDWGAGVSTELAADHSDSCVGMHTNMATVGPDRDTLDNPLPIEEEAMRGSQFYQEWDSGYSKQQSTRPQTLGYGLVDSPIGQAAWVLEKFYQWTDCDGHPENAISRDRLLDNVMFYWLPGCGASSGRIYWESFGRGGSRNPVEVPSGVSVFPKEIFKVSERWAKRRYKDLRYYNQLDKGGHFAAFEQPELFVAELRACFRKM